MNGTDLLAEFRKSRAEAAFGELVRRYTNLVYSVAKRRLSNGSQAEEVTQTVFIRLAKAAPDLHSDAELVAWLHRTTVHASIDLWRSEMRRRTREEHAAAMHTDPAQDTIWNELAPVLDDALNELNDAERQVVLLRFFEQKSMRDLGSALGISEDAAKMRVSRAMDRLRTLVSARGVVCGAAALAALLTERSVEAAPAGLVLALAALPIPAAVTLGAGTGVTALLTHLSKAKVVAGLTTLVIGAATLIWLVSANRQSRSPSTGADQTSSNLASLDNGGAASSASADSNTVAEPGAPDPIKLLKGVARARNRISSGEMEFEVARYEFDRPVNGTNHTRLTTLFDGTKRRVESLTREYAYVSLSPETNEVVDARMRTDGLDQEAAVKAGLLSSFESHHVTAYDGALFLDYSENDGKPFQTRIDDPAKGGGTYAFDPRCLGIDTYLMLRDTVEDCLAYEVAASVQLMGEDFVAGTSAWHVRVMRGLMNLDFWLETAHPTRVLRHTFNGSEVTSKYDEANPRDAIPIEVNEMLLHGTTGTQTAFTWVHITRPNARFNLPVDPASWTLAGLGMKVGTDVVDYRNSRSLGYWTGTGLSEGLPPKSGDPQPAPDRAEKLALLDNDPASPGALEAAQWIMFNTPDGPEVEKAADVVLQDHIENTNLVHLCLELERLRHRCTKPLLEALLEKNPSTEVRGNACLALATVRKDEAKYGQNKTATAEAEKLFERVISEFGQVKREGQTLANLAKPELYELGRVSLGQPAPDTVGEDLEGRPLSLSDYRGKVVVLNFWGECGGCRPEVPPLLKLLDRLNGQPFAILGVYCDKDLDHAKAIAEELGITWPSFRDGRTGPISTAWNNNSWPVFNVLDSKGIIRYRHLVSYEVPGAVDALMKE